MPSRLYAIDWERMNLFTTVPFTRMEIHETRTYTSRQLAEGLHRATHAVSTLFARCFREANDGDDGAEAFQEVSALARLLVSDGVHTQDIEWEIHAPANGRPYRLTVTAN